MLRIFADFNSCDDQGNVRLNTVGSLRDIAGGASHVAIGQKVILYTPDEFEVVGLLDFDEGIWKAKPDWSTIKYY